MPDLEPIKKNSDEFKKGFGLSLALHLFIAALFIVNMVFFSKPLIDFSQAISVSIGEFKSNENLPEKSTAEEHPTAEKIEEDLPQQNEEPVETKKTVEKKLPPKEKVKTPEISLKKAKSKQKAALDKLKKISALEKINQDIKKDAIAKIKRRTAAEAKPRIVPAGSALNGLDKLQAGQYLQQIDQAVKQFWRLPQWLMNKPLKAKVLVKFNRNGEILSSQITASSGNSSYDQYCLQAITEAAPFPKVPEKFSEKFSLDGVVIGFPE